MNYGNIKDCDIANGAGVRVSLFVSGCTLHCEGCFQPETWDFEYGKPFTVDTEDQIIAMLRPAYIRGLSVLGGEPFEKPNQRVLSMFLKRVRETLPDKDIWVYSGYVFDKDIVPEDGRVHTPGTIDMLKCIDVLVDGQFVEADHDVSLVFRGSSNQRLIDVAASLDAGTVVEYGLPDRSL